MPLWMTMFASYASCRNMISHCCYKTRNMCISASNAKRCWRNCYNSYCQSILQMLLSNNIVNVITAKQYCKVTVKQYCKCYRHCYCQIILKLLLENFFANVKVTCLPYCKIAVVTLSFILYNCQIILLYRPFPCKA